jgi:transposase-like protein
MTTRRKFTPEFKAEAVQLAIDCNNVSKTARNLGISETALGKWVKAYKAKNKEDGTHLSPMDIERVRQLERDNARLAKENEFLKKAAAFFAKSQVL